MSHPDIPPGYCLAAWSGGSAVMIGGRVVQPGDTVVVPESEAAESLNWSPVPAPKPPRKSRPTSAPGAGEEG